MKMQNRMATILALLTILGASAGLADSYYLKNDATGKKHGPFSLRAGESIRLGTNVYRIVQIPVRPPTIAERLRKTIIPEVAFRNAAVIDVIAFLREASEIHSPYDDPAHRGVNIIFNVPRDSELAKRGITFRARRITLGNALGAVLKTTRLTSKVEGNLLIIEPRQGL